MKFRWSLFAFSTAVSTLGLSAQCGGDGSNPMNPMDMAPPAPVAPDFSVKTSLSDVAPGQRPELQAVAADGAAHATWTYVWTDGLTGAQQGTITPKGAGMASDVLYTPASCSALGGGDVSITVSVAVQDSATGLSTTKTQVLTAHCPAPTYYATKTLYKPQQDPVSYEPAPDGYSPVYTELVARHGARGLTGLKEDAAAYVMWQKASADGALTQLGQGLGPDAMSIMKANALMGAGVAGIQTPGYGNLTAEGISEHQGLASRMLQRLSAYFTQVAATSGTASPRNLLVLSSGQGRAVDSANFFAGTVATQSAALGSLTVNPPAPTGYPAGAPVTQPAGTNRFLLYFHKLAAKTDLVTDTTDPYYQTYQDSLAYQAYATDADVNAKVTAALTSTDAKAAARTVLEGLFTKDFVDKIDNGTYSFANTGTYTFMTADNSYMTTLTGDGKTTIKSLVDAAEVLYSLYIIAPGMSKEAGVDFTKYIPVAQANVLSYLSDVQDFYEMGPGIQEANPVTYKMAQRLEDDFFNEVDAIEKGDLSHAAKLRFTHAEIIVPFASILGLKGAFTPVPKASTYSYTDNTWRGEVVAPMAANVQWDVYRNAAGSLLVKMLYNEREADFKPDCDSAKLTPFSHYYDYTKLKACYHHGP